MRRLRIYTTPAGRVDEAALRSAMESGARVRVAGEGIPADATLRHLLVERAALRRLAIAALGVESAAFEDVAPSAWLPWCQSPADLAIDVVARAS